MFQQTIWCVFQSIFCEFPFLFQKIEEHCLYICAPFCLYFLPLEMFVMFEKNHVLFGLKLGCTIFMFFKNEFPSLVPAITASLSHYGVMKHPRYGGDMIQLIDL